MHGNASGLPFLHSNSHGGSTASRFHLLDMNNDCRISCIPIRLILSKKCRSGFDIKTTQSAICAVMLLQCPSGTDLPRIASGRHFLCRIFFSGWYLKEEPVSASDICAHEPVNWMTASAFCKVGKKIRSFGTENIHFPGTRYTKLVDTVCDNEYLVGRQVYPRPGVALPGLFPVHFYGVQR